MATGLWPGGASRLQAQRCAGRGEEAGGVSVQRASLGAPAVPSGSLSSSGGLCPGSSSDRERMGRGSFDSSSA